MASPPTFTQHQSYPQLRSSSVMEKRPSTFSCKALRARATALLPNGAIDAAIPPSVFSGSTQRDSEALTSECRSFCVPRLWAGRAGLELLQLPFVAHRPLRGGAFSQARPTSAAHSRSVAACTPLELAFLYTVSKFAACTVVHLA